ncbi:hypothetical protein TNCV_4074681 [Trichonephila clavipes]|nr:hypothetical protein TNCV_4074681 [Trichonephila clavipes]
MLCKDLGSPPRDVGERSAIDDAPRNFEPRSSDEDKTLLSELPHQANGRTYNSSTDFTRIIPSMQWVISSTETRSHEMATMSSRL